MILLALAVWSATGCETEDQKPAAPTLSIRDRTVKLEIAQTNAARSRGLGYRESLDWGSGMLFLYDEEPGFPAFWMKGMRFDIDIVWLREGRIVDISHRVRHSPEGNGDQVRPRAVTDMVLEVPAGFAQAHGWQAGDRVDLELGDGIRDGG